MDKKKVVLCGIFVLCCFVVVVFGASESNQSKNSNPNLNGKPAENVELSRVFERLDAQEKRIKGLEKSQKELKSEVKSLKEEIAELKQRISRDDGIRLLKQLLRDPQEKQANQGDQGPLDPGSPKSCSDAMEIFSSPRSAKQWIYPDGNDVEIEVLCDFDVDGGGWTVIQKRSCGPQDQFDRGWSDYSSGFGSLDGNFWLGLENIRALTKNGDQELRIQLEDFEGNTKWAKYSNFSISDASDFYQLSIGGFSGDVEDDMQHHDGSSFSTPDQDNDKDSGNCAADASSGWWFIERCFWANLNGLYRQKEETVPRAKGIHWGTWTGYSLSMAKTVMQIRTKT